MMTPDEEKLIPFVDFAKKFGHKFDMSSPDKIAESFNQLLKDAHGKPEQHVLEQLGIRTMAKANIQSKILVIMVWDLNIIVILLHLFADIRM